MDVCKGERTKDVLCRRVDCSWKNQSREKWNWMLGQFIFAAWRQWSVWFLFQILTYISVWLPAAAFPHVAAYKHSEHGNEKDKAVLVCVSHGYPLPTDWAWFKEEDGVRNVCLPECSIMHQSRHINRYSITMATQLRLTCGLNPPPVHHQWNQQQIRDQEHPEQDQSDRQRPEHWERRRRLRLLRNEWNRHSHGQDPPARPQPLGRPVALLGNRGRGHHTGDHHLHLREEEKARWDQWWCVLDVL